MEEKIYAYLIAHHVGKANLIKNKDLREIFGIKSDRTLRKIIQNIRENKDFYLVVGSVSGRTGGFYICQTIEEINETIDGINHRANQMLKGCYIIEWKKEKVLKNE